MLPDGSRNAPFPVRLDPAPATAVWPHAVSGDWPALAVPR